MRKPDHKPDDRKPNYLTFAEAAKEVPGGRRAYATIWGWATKGVRVRGGSRVYLRFIRVGGQNLTAREWMMTFFEELAALNRDHHTTMQHANRIQHEVSPISHREAEVALQEAGA